MRDFQANDIQSGVLADVLGLDGDAMDVPDVLRLDPDRSDPVPSLRAMLREQLLAEPEREPWPADWFDATDPGQVAACRALWGAALTERIKTALGIDAKYTRRSRAGGGGLLTSSWFWSKDFRTMCELAGLDATACAERLSDPEALPEIKRLLMSKNLDQSQLGWR